MRFFALLRLKNASGTHVWMLQGVRSVVKAVQRLRKAREDRVISFLGTYTAFDISGSNEDVSTLWPSVGAMPAASAMSSDLHMQG